MPDPKIGGSVLTPTLAGDLRIVLSRLNRRLREQGHSGDITSSQKAVLLHLERQGPATVTTLARAEGVRPQSMGATIASLQAAGLVTGAPDAADGRQTILSLTSACAEWIRTIRTAREDWLFRALDAKLTPAEQQELAGAVVLLERLLDQ